MTPDPYSQQKTANAGSIEQPCYPPLFYVENTKISVYVEISTFFFLRVK